MTDERESIVLAETWGESYHDGCLTLDGNDAGSHAHLYGVGAEAAKKVRDAGPGELVFIPKRKPDPKEPIDVLLARLCGFGVVGATYEADSRYPYVNMDIVWPQLYTGSGAYERWNPTEDRNQFDMYVKKAMAERGLYRDRVHFSGDTAGVTIRTAWGHFKGIRWVVDSTEKVPIADELPASCRTALEAVAKLEEEKTT